MKLLISSLIALLSFVPASADKFDFIKSIRPMQLRTEDLTHQQAYNLFEMGADLDAEFQNMCTAFAIGKGELDGKFITVFGTAAHCVLKEDDLTGEVTLARRYVDGKEITVFGGKADLDVAAFAVEAQYPTLKMGKAPKLGTEIYVAGHPFGYPAIFVTRGYVANVKGDLGDFKPYMLLDVAGAPGNSGSPVLNLKGEVVSVVQIGWDQFSFSPVMGGIVYEDFKEFFKPFFN